MAAVLTTSSTVLCGPVPPHLGAVVVKGNPKLTVSSAGVLLEDGIKGQSISAAQKCQIVDNTNSGNKHCTSVMAVTTTLATKLKVATKPVVLMPLSGGTDGTLGGTLQTALAATANQAKLTAI